MRVQIDEITVDQKIQLRARWLDQSTVQRYVEALAGGAEFPPIVAFSDNGILWLADGFHRLAAYRFLGLADVEANIKDGDRDAAMVYAATANVTNGLPMTAKQKRQAGERLLKLTDWETLDIARKLAVSRSTVQNWALQNKKNKKPASSDNLAQSCAKLPDTIHPATNNLVPKNAALAFAVIDAQRDGRMEWTPETDPCNPEFNAGRAFDELTKRRKDHVMAVMGSSESPEWYTPSHIIELTLKLFGGTIDTDPCSNSKKIPNVPATFLYTKEDDGLVQTWHGAVYMNPPYGTEIPRWVEALISRYESGEIREAIALLPGRIDTRWFQPLYDYLICHIRGRLNYPQSKSATPFPSVIVYLGDNRSAFIEVFKALGPIMRRVG